MALSPEETPALDALARRGTRFPAARTPVPLTLPAHLTIFTGLLPPEHGGAGTTPPPRSLRVRSATSPSWRRSSPTRATRPPPSSRRGCSMRGMASTRASPSSGHRRIPLRAIHDSRNWRAKSRRSDSRVSSRTVPRVGPTSPGSISGNLMSPTCPMRGMSGGGGVMRATRPRNATEARCAAPTRSWRGSSRRPTRRGR
ncbi:MAG: sulfatase-like hydrolase/transferase [Planctomycetes bacterium]|nr:sulfatase-like hydrolase/transferase [Planctomycetota bacterium]